jgi:hypothetical protein
MQNDAQFRLLNVDRIFVQSSEIKAPSTDGINDTNITITAGNKLEIKNNANLIIPDNLNINGPNFQTQPKFLNNDLSTKQYVDSVIQGLDIKESVKVTTTTNIILNGIHTIDGIVLSEDDRILVKNQNNSVENGIYLVKANAWIRSSDLQTGQIIDRAIFVFIESGDIYKNNGWILNLSTNSSLTIGNDNLLYTQFSGAGLINAGNNLVKNGNNLNLNSDIIGLTNINSQNITSINSLIIPVGNNIFVDQNNGEKPLAIIDNKGMIRYNTEGYLEICNGTEWKSFGDGIISDSDNDTLINVNNNNDIEFYTGDNDNNSYNRMIIKENGNVGIGITNPLKALEVNGSLETSGEITCVNLTVHQSNTQPSVNITGNIYTQGSLELVGDLNINTPNTLFVDNITSNSDILNITSINNVNNLNSLINIINTNGTSENDAIKIESQLGGVSIYAHQGIKLNSKNHSHFIIDGTGEFRFETKGNINQKILFQTSTSNRNDAIHFYSINGGILFETNQNIKFNNNVIISSTGNLGIGVTNPNEELEVNGTVKATNFIGNLTGDVIGNADTATKIATITNSDIVQLTASQTLTNKSLTSPTITGTGSIAGTFTGDVTGNVTGNADTATKIATITNSDIVQLTASQTLTNKSLTSPTITSPTITGTGSIAGTFTGDVTGNADTATKIATITNTDIVQLTESQTLTNKSLTSPTITSPTITGTGSIAGTFTGDVTGNVTGNADTATKIATITNTDIVQLTESQTLTNKSLTSPTITSPTITGTGSIAGTFTGDITGDVTGNADTATKIATITNSNIVQLTESQTLTNKSLTSPTITSPTITGTGSIAGTFTGDITGNVTGDVTGNANTVTNGIYTTSNVTDLNDVSDAGSGLIITDIERSKLTNLLSSSWNNVTKYNYNVTANNDKYYLNNIINPILYLTKNKTYIFNYPSGHPLNIYTTGIGGNTNNIYNNNISIDTNNNSLTFIIPNDAPNELYYHCELHANMGNIIYIIEDIDLDNGNVGIGTNLPEAKLEVNGTVKATGFSMGGHILPTDNATYDIGSAEYKIRHLFLSDNSLWIGDEHKLSVDNNKVGFKKRKKKNNQNIIPRNVLRLIDPALNSNITQAIADNRLGGKTPENLTIDEWDNIIKTHADPSLSINDNQYYDEQGFTITDPEFNHLTAVKVYDDNFEDYSKKPEYDMIQLGTRWRIRENKYSQLVFEQNISFDANDEDKNYIQKGNALGVSIPKTNDVFVKIEHKSFLTTIILDGSDAVDTNLTYSIIDTSEYGISSIVNNTINYFYQVGENTPLRYSDTITYIAINSAGYKSEPATVYITITPENFTTRPYAPDFTVKVSSTIHTKIMLKAYDADNTTTLLYHIVSTSDESGQGPPSIVVEDTRTASFVYDSAGYIGTETITYKVSNDTDNTFSNTATITIITTAPTSSNFYCITNAINKLPDYNQPYNQSDGPQRPNTGRLFYDFDAWCAPTCGSQLLAYWYLEHGKLFTAPANGNYETGNPEWNYYMLNYNRKPPYALQRLETIDIGFSMNTNNLGDQGMSNNSAHIGTFVQDIHKGLWNIIKSLSSIAIIQVTQINQNTADHTITIETENDHNYTGGNKIKIEGYSYNDFNDIWTIEPVTNTKLLKIKPQTVDNGGKNINIMGTNNLGSGGYVNNIEIGVSTVSNSFAFGYETSHGANGNIIAAMSYALSNTNMIDDIINEITYNRPVIINYISYHLQDLNKKITIIESEILTDVSYYKIQPQGPLNVESEIKEQYNYGEDGYNLGHSCVCLAVIPKGSKYDISMGNNNWLICLDNDVSTTTYVAIEFDIGIINSISKINLKDL